MNDVARVGDSSPAALSASPGSVPPHPDPGEASHRREAVSLLHVTAVGHPTCMLARRLDREELCSSECAFWEDGGAVLPAGCALERILGEGDWPVELAARWLRIRDRIGSAADWQPAGFFSILLS